MTYTHEAKRGRVAEPVQVYLESADRGVLEQLAQHLDLSKSDVLRRALATLARETFAAESHPALRLVGIGEQHSEPRLTYDPAVEHDRYLARVSEPAVAKPRKGRRGK
ncbi:MAG: hypothetical protein U0163_10970 [Gemmatimonadaceae bacterium]